MVHQAVSEVSERIDNRDIRGSVRIAREIATAMETQAKDTDADDPEAFRESMQEAAWQLRETRTGAVSLSNTLRFILRNMKGDTVEEFRESTIAAVEEFQQNLETARETLGRIGARRLRDGDTVMTHCHSTDALSIVKHALADGKDISAFVKETRPRNQGHITAQQLREWGVPVTIIVDNAAFRYLDDVDHVLAGAHSIAADGSVVNSVGTSTLAVAAQERNVPVTVAAQTLKLHSDALTGTGIDLEMRDGSEVLDDAVRSQIGDVDILNPVSDVTPPDHIDAIVTERGQFSPESIVTLIHDLYGESTVDAWEFGDDLD
jgi:ribose 1,5-bisphosphate isomerase